MRFLWAKTLDVLPVTAAACILFLADRRLGSPTAHGFRAKSHAHAHTDRFPDTGICPHSQPDSYRDPERSNADQSQSDADSNSNADCDSDPNAPVSRSECHTDHPTPIDLPLISFCSALASLTQK